MTANEIAASYNVWIAQWQPMIAASYNVWLNGGKKSLACTGLRWSKINSNFGLILSADELQYQWFSQPGQVSEVHILALFGLDWMLENWHGNIWEDLENPKSAEPLSLIESPLSAQEISLSLSDETVLFLIGSRWMFWIGGDFCAYMHTHTHKQTHTYREVYKCFKQS